MLQKVVEAKTKITSNKDIALAAPGRWSVSGEPGLYLHVSTDGQVRRWLFRFTSPVSMRVTETGLDIATLVSLSQAKNKAHDLRKQISAGICPIHAKRAEQASRITFREVSDGWIKTHEPSWKPGVDGKDGSQMKCTKLLLHHHGAPLANKPVKDITPDIIQAALEKIWARAPYQGRRTLRMWSRVLDYAKAKGLRIGDNPADWRGNMEYRFARRRSKDQSHHPALPYEQVPEFMKDLRASQGRATTCLEFTILTCARTSEVLGMQWPEVDWEKRTWTVPKERMKAGKEHVVPLSDRAIEILKQRHVSSDRLVTEYVFVGYNRTKLAERSLRAVLTAMKSVSCTVHGFRSTFRDWAGDTTHFVREHVEECLAHQVGNDVERAYRRATALEKRRTIMASWAEYCSGTRR